MAGAPGQVRSAGYHLDMRVIFYRRFRRGWHPFLFMLTLGTMIAALVNGSILVALIMALCVIATVIR